jgi:hypothetical protein
MGGREGSKKKAGARGSSTSSKLSLQQHEEEEVQGSSSQPASSSAAAEAAEAQHAAAPAHPTSTGSMHAAHQEHVHLVAMMFGHDGIPKQHCKTAALLLLEHRPELGPALQQKDYALVAGIIKDSAPNMMYALNAVGKRAGQSGRAAAPSEASQAAASAGASSRALAPADAGVPEVDMLDAEAAAEAAAEADAAAPSLAAPPVASAPARQHGYYSAEYDWEPRGEGQQAQGSPAQQQEEEVTFFLRTIELTRSRDIAGMSNEELVAECGPWASDAALLRDAHAGVLATKQVCHQVGGLWSRAACMYAWHALLAATASRCRHDGCWRKCLP